MFLRKNFSPDSLLKAVVSWIGAVVNVIVVGLCYFRGRPPSLLASPVVSEICASEDLDVNLDSVRCTTVSTVCLCDAKFFSGPRVHRLDASAALRACVYV